MVPTRFALLKLSCGLLGVRSQARYVSLTLIELAQQVAPASQRGVLAFERADVPMLHSDVSSTSAPKPLAPAPEAKST